MQIASGAFFAAAVLGVAFLAGRRRRRGFLGGGGDGSAGGAGVRRVRRGMGREDFLGSILCGGLGVGA